MDAAGARTPETLRNSPRGAAGMARGRLVDRIVPSRSAASNLSDNAQTHYQFSDHSETREVIDAVYRNHFGAFVCRAFEALNPGQRLVENWHIEAVCYSIQKPRPTARLRLRTSPPNAFTKDLVARFICNKQGIFVPPGRWRLARRLAADL